MRREDGSRSPLFLRQSAPMPWYPRLKPASAASVSPCLGDRIHTGTSENEMIFSIPAARFSEVASGLAATSEGMPLPVPLPMEYALQSPERYKQYMRDIGLEE